MNPFERLIKRKENIENTPAIQELLKQEMQRVASTVGTESDNITENEIHGAVLRALHAADHVGEPLTEEKIKEGGAILDDKLLQALNAEIAMRDGARPNLRVVGADYNVVRDVASKSEASHIAQDLHEAA